MANATGSRFVWHELETTDPATAINFYRKVVGWDEQPWAQDPTYRMLAGGGRGMAGVMALGQDALDMGATPMWLSYVSVPDVDASLRRAEGLGAKTLVPAQDIPHVGRFAVLMDPQHAAFAVFKPLPMPGMDAGEGDADLLDWCWHEYIGTDWESAWRFYSALFGWEEAERMDMGPAGTYFMYRRPGTTQTLGGFYAKPSDMPGPAGWLPYVRVRDSDAAAALVTKHGGKVMVATDVPGGGRIAMCLDPEGAMFALHTFATDLKKHAAARRATRKAKKPAARKPAKKAVKAKKTARKTAKKTTRKRK